MSLENQNNGYSCLLKRKLFLYTLNFIMLNSIGKYLVVKYMGTYFL